MDVQATEHDLPVFEDDLGHDHQVKLPGDHSPNSNPVLELIKLDFDAQSTLATCTQVAYILQVPKK